MSAAAVAAAKQQVADLVAKGAFRPVERYLPSEIAEERVQDAVCQTMEMAARYAERGKQVQPAILVHYCRLRATDPTRQFVRSHGRGLDPLNPHLYMRGKVAEVLHLELPDEDDGGFDEDRPLGFALSLSSNPTAAIMDALDLLDWLEELPAVDVELLAARLEGLTLAEVGERLAFDVGYVCQRLRALGRELAARAEWELPRTRRGRRSKAESAASASAERV
jgi:hypothetical protein